MCTSTLYYSHLLHQESGILVMGNAFADAVIEVQTIFLDGAFKAIVPDLLWVYLLQLPKLQIMGGYHAHAIILQKMGDQLL